MNYPDYLKSSHWQSVRKDTLQRAGNRCQLCASSSQLEVHHNNYQNLWREDDRDLIVLCGNCHERHHGILQPPPAEVAAMTKPETVNRIPRSVTEEEFETIKTLWIEENRAVLAAQSRKITETERAERVSIIREQIEAIRYE